MEGKSRTEIIITSVSFSVVRALDSVDKKLSSLSITVRFVVVQSIHQSVRQFVRTYVVGIFSAVTIMKCHRGVYLSTSMSTDLLSVCVSEYWDFGVLTGT